MVLFLRGGRWEGKNVCGSGRSATGRLEHTCRVSARASSPSSSMWLLDLASWHLPSACPAWIWLHQIVRSGWRHVEPDMQEQGMHMKATPWPDDILLGLPRLELLPHDDGCWVCLRSNTRHHKKSPPFQKNHDFECSPMGHNERLGKFHD